MEENKNPFYDFIIERTQEDKKEAMAELLNQPMQPPGGGGGDFDPDAFRKRNELMMSMMTEAGAEEMRKMMQPPPMEDYDESLEQINWLQQPNKFKWKDVPVKASVDELRAATANAKRAKEMTCECWNAGCQFAGDCRKCIVFHLALKQFPTCQRQYLGDYEEHYIKFSQDTTK